MGGGKGIAHSALCGWGPPPYLGSPFSYGSAAPAERGRGVTMSVRSPWSGAMHNWVTTSLSEKEGRSGCGRRDGRGGVGTKTKKGWYGKGGPRRQDGLGSLDEAIAEALIIVLRTFLVAHSSFAWIRSVKLAWAGFRRNVEFLKAVTVWCWCFGCGRVEGWAPARGWVALALSGWAGRQAVATEGAPLGT